MEKYNIEDQLAEKLGRRSIEPSADSWERVAFSKARPSKRKPAAKWFGIAATLALLIAAGLYISSNEEAETKIHPATKIVFIEKSDEIATESAVMPSEPSNRQIKLMPKSIAHKPSTISEDTALPSPAIITPAAAQQPSDLPKDRLILQKSEEIAAELQRRIDVHLPVTDAVVDSLLQKAQREIAMERAKSNGGPTDANALLKETETEINETFREDAIRLFKNRFRTIRIALH